jgi:serine/threonine protein kinase
LNKEFEVYIRDYGYTALKDGLKKEDVEAAEVAYIAPELFSFTVDTEYDESVDIYSFGFILWQMFTRKNPFDGMDKQQIIYAVKEEEQRPPIPQDTPFVFSRLIQLSWASEPHVRPPFEKIYQISSQPLTSILSYSSPSSSNAQQKKEVSGNFQLRSEFHFD